MSGLGYVLDREGDTKMTKRDIMNGLYSFTRGNFNGMKFNSDFRRVEMDVDSWARLAQMVSGAYALIEGDFGSSSGWPYNLVDDIFEAREYSDGEWKLTDRTMCSEEDLIKGIEYVMKDLTDRERECVYKYYRDGRTLRDIGKDYDVTTERIRQVLSRARRRLRNPARVKYITKGYRIASQDVYNKYKAMVLEEIKRAQVDAWEISHKEAEKLRLNAEAEKAQEMLRTDIGDLDISVRSYNCLKRAGVNTLGELMEVRHDLKKIRNLGTKCEWELLEVLRGRGLIQ